MKCRTGLCVLTTLLVATACAPHANVPAQAPSLSRAATDSARTLSRALVERERLPGLAVTVKRGRQLLWHEGVGFADVNARTPATPETRFRIGSVSKLLTALTLMRLSQDGAVDLDAPISRAMDSLPVPLRDITLRQLAGHLAGIRHYRGNEFLSAASCRRLREGIAVFAGDTLVAMPGSRYSYSSYGFNLIGAVLESVTRRPYPDIVRRQVLAPLQMDATGPTRQAYAISGARGRIRSPTSAVFPPPTMT